MKNKRLLTIISLTSLFAVVVGMLLSNSRTIGLCARYEYSCSGFWGEGIGMPLMFFGTSIFLLSIILRFLHERIFRTWAWFALVYLPIAAILIATTPSQCDAPVNLCGDRELVNWFLAGLFLLSSLTLITIKFFKIRKQSPAPSRIYESNI